MPIISLAKPASNTLEKAWYKQFWPWFLIILPAIVVVASIATAVIAFKGADVVVADNYYKEGLAINTTFDETQFAKAHNISAKIVFTNNNLTLNLNANNVTTPTTLSLQFKHPMDNTLDTYLILPKNSDGAYYSKFPILKKGKWYITLQPHTEKPQWRIDTTTFLPKSNINIIAE